jgi:hypothetical protein
VSHDETHISCYWYGNLQQSLIYFFAFVLAQGPAPSDSGAKKRKRVPFTEAQVAGLEALWQNTQTPKPAQRQEAASAIGLSVQQVANWFDSKRKKLKAGSSAPSASQSGGSKGKTTKGSTSAPGSAANSGGESTAATKPSPMDSEGLPHADVPAEPMECDEGDARDAPITGVTHPSSEAAPPGEAAAPSQTPAPVNATATSDPNEPQRGVAETLSSQGAKPLPHSANPAEHTCTAGTREGSPEKLQTGKRPASPGEATPPQKRARASSPAGQDTPVGHASVSASQKPSAGLPAPTETVQEGAPADPSVKGAPGEAAPEGERGAEAIGKEGVPAQSGGGALPAPTPAGGSGGLTGAAPAPQAAKGKAKAGRKSGSLPPVTEEQRVARAEATHEEMVQIQQTVAQWPPLCPLPELLQPKRSEMKRAEV